MANYILDLGYDYGVANNGQIQTVHYYTAPGVEDQTRSESFTYDAWGRLRQAQTLQVSAGAPGTFKLQWGYDQLGNRLSQSLLDGNLPNGAGVPSLTISTASNRITTPGYTYDGVGNVLHDAASAYTYDGAAASPPSTARERPIRISARCASKRSWADHAQGRDRTARRSRRGCTNSI